MISVMPGLWPYRGSQPLKAGSGICGPAHSTARTGPRLIKTLEDDSEAMEVVGSSRDSRADS
jgi:hypothetical protein